MRVSRLLTNRRLFILLASVILLIVIAGVSLRGKYQRVSWPVRMIMDVQSTVQSWIYRPVSKLTSFMGGIHDLHEMYVENAQLKAEMQNYDELNAELKDQNAAVARLNTMLDFKNTSFGQSLNTVPAHVIGRDPTQWNSEVTIDVGSRDGVKEDMAIISPNGSLVGRVAQTAEYSSKVILVTDTQIGDGVSAYVQNGTSQPQFGIVVGSPTINGKLQINFLSPVAQFAPGDTVVTSGLSTVFPKGIIIGTVIKVSPGTQDLTQSAVVQPAANLEYVQDVFVVKNVVSKK